MQVFSLHKCYPLPFDATRKTLLLFLFPLLYAGLNSCFVCVHDSTTPRVHMSSNATTRSVLDDEPLPDIDLQVGHEPSVKAHLLSKR